MNIVMIAVHKKGNKIVGFRLIDTDTEKIQDVPYDNLIGVVQSGKADVENVTIEDGRLVGTNGTLQRFPTLTEGRIYGKSPLIILFELANNRYRVTNYLGEIVDITEQEAINYAQTEGIANGKIVSDENGRSHISSISGTYKQDKLIEDKKYGKKLVAKMKLLGVKDYTLDDNYKAKVTNKDIEELTFAKGVLGIQPSGCKDLKKLKEVTFPETFDELGDLGFSGCESLEEVTIPEGIVTIPQKCFANCKKLKAVHLPNSLRKIEGNAFYGCDKLKLITTGPVPIEIGFGGIPRGVKRVKR